MIPKKIHVLTSDVKMLNAGILFRGSFLSLNPHWSRTEYTDLSQVWHKPEEEPKKGEWILGEYQGGIYQTYLCGYVDCEWSSYVKVFSLIRWAYVNDLLPKGGEQ